MITFSPTSSDLIGSYEFTVKESNILVPFLSSQIILTAQITKCALLSFTTTDSLPSTLYFILGGPAV
jgi:hypothetical protein